MKDNMKPVLTVILLFSGAVSAFAANQSDTQARVYLDSKTQYIDILNRDLDIVSSGADYYEIITDSSELSALNAAGFRTEILQERLTEFYRSRMNMRTLTGMGAYKTLDELYAALDVIITDHPGIITTKQPIGTTIEGRTMWAVKISDNPNMDEPEPEVLFTAAIHAREVITPEVLLFYMNYLTDNYGSDPEVTTLVDTREIWFVLVVNPDGYFHNEVIAPGGGGMWRKNRRENADMSFGVDLNRNYGMFWGYDDIGSSPVTTSQTYRGTGPFSEPETTNMKNFIESREFVITVYYHSYSNLVLWPWGFERSYTPDEDIYAAMGDTIKSFNGYAPGPGWTLYLVNGDSDDWGYGEQTTKNKNFSMVFEVGSSSDGFWPDPSRIGTLVSENLQPNLFLTRVSSDVYKLRAPEAPSIILAATVDSTGYTVDWTFTDTTNPAVMFELVEFQGKEAIVDQTADMSNWENDGFSVSNSRAVSFPSSFYSGTGNSHTSTIDTRHPYTVMSGDSLTFSAWYNVEVNWDYAYVEISTDGKTFTPIPGNITTDFNPNGNNRGNGITGLSNGWESAAFDLSAYVGQDVWFRFTYQTDGFIFEEGFYIDNISPTVTFANETVISSTITDTSFPFVDKPLGVYYYIVRARDAEAQWGEFSPFAQTLVISPGVVCVDTDGDGFGDPRNPNNGCPDDNCPSQFNPAQADTDSDGIGDACDNCPTVFSLDQADADADGIGDLCDNCPTTFGSDQTDTDSDGVGNLCDNCPQTFNPDQSDSDGNNIGDACQPCCVGNAGNIDDDAADIVDIADLTMLIDHLFISFPPLACPEEGNINGDQAGLVDIADLTMLIDHLFIDFIPTSACQ